MSMSGKILKKIDYSQLTSYLDANNVLSDCHHGSRNGRSTLTNLLSRALQIANIIEAGHSFDLVSSILRKPLARSHTHISLVN